MTRTQERKSLRLLLWVSLLGFGGFLRLRKIRFQAACHVSVVSLDNAKGEGLTTTSHTQQINSLTSLMHFVTKTKTYRSAFLYATICYWGDVGVVKVQLRYCLPRK